MIDSKLNETNKFISNVKYKDKIYCIPYKASKIAIINTIDNSVELLGEFNNDFKYSKGISVLHNIYCIPYNIIYNIISDRTYREKRGLDVEREPDVYIGICTI